MHVGSADRVSLSDVCRMENGEAVPQAAISSLSGEDHATS